MKLVVKSLIFLFFIITGCTHTNSKYIEQEEITQQLLTLISERNFSGIKSMYGVDPLEIGLSDENILVIIDAINISLRQSNKVKINNYKYTEYPSNSPKLVDILIPISQDKGCEEFIKVSFVKYTAKGKFYDFDIEKCIPNNLDDVMPPGASDSVSN